MSGWRVVIFSSLLLFVAAIVISEYFRPVLLLVGNTTIDLVGGKQPVGGAISYAAVVAAALGVRACVVTAAGPNTDLTLFEGHELHVVPANATLTFEHTYTWWGNRRKLQVTAQPNVTLGMRHIPRHCRRARIIMLGPLTLEDLDAPELVQYQPSLWDRLVGFQPHIGLMAQGLQRTLAANGRVVSSLMPNKALEDSLRPGVSVFLSDVETDVWPNGTLEQLSLSCSRFVVTRGEFGADEYQEGRKVNYPSIKVDTVADTNGAGDSFATGYMTALARGDASPGYAGNWAGSRAVMQSQECKPQCVADMIRRDLPSSSFPLAWLHLHLPQYINHCQNKLWQLINRQNTLVVGK